MNEGRWVTLKDGRRIMINDYMNDKIRKRNMPPMIKQKELDDYLQKGGIVYKGLQGNARIYEKNGLTPNVKFLIRRDTWSKYMLNSKVKRISSEKNEYGDYEYILK